MKQLCILAICAYCAISVKAQSSICGIPFGLSYEITKSHLINKYGNAEVYENNEIWYFNRDYAGIPFWFIKFKFQSDGNSTYFNECTMGQKFKDVSSAKKFRNKLFAELSAKYDNIEIYKEKNGFLSLEGGESPIDENKSGFSVYIVRSKKQYIVFLSYGPYNYAHEEF